MGRKPTKRAPPARATPSEYADLFDFAPATYAIIDETGIIVRISAAAAHLLKADPLDLSGLPLASFVAPEDRNEWLDHLSRAKARSTVVESEIRFVPKQSTRVTCRVHSRRAWHDGRLLIPTVIEDQSEYRALDESRLAAERLRSRAEREAAIAIAASEEKDHLISAVSHELRTPLTPALVAAGQLAAWDDLPEAAQHLASTIKRNIELQARLIDDLLDVARIRNNRMELRFEAVDVHEVLREAIRICGPFSDRKNLTITEHFCAGSRLVRGDPARLRQVFWNLLNNAIKFSDHGGSVVISTDTTPDATITIQFQDFGTGMTGPAMEQLFTPFHHRSGSESRSGLGLGLTICKGIVDAHDGRIWGRSQGPGQGSIFGVELTTLPIEQRSADPYFGLERAAQGTANKPDRPERVLLVEDDADSSEMLALSLSLHGFVVEVAASLAEGLRKLDEGWDVVMSDIRLPDGSGLNLARRASRLRPRPGRLIALTGFGSDEDVKASREAGFDLHLVKPIDLEQLLSTLSAQPSREG
jgi:PAS domain S-box-containing protein